MNDKPGDVNTFLLDELQKAAAGRRTEVLNAMKALEDFRRSPMSGNEKLHWILKEQLKIAFSCERIFHVAFAGSPELLGPEEVKLLEDFNQMNQTDTRALKSRWNRTAEGWLTPDGKRYDDFGNELTE